MNMQFYRKLPIPKEIKEEYPVSAELTALRDNCIAEQKKIFESAANQLLEAVIDGYSGEFDVEYEGLIHHVTAGVPQNIGIDECAIYGDYFYLEALMRYKNPDWVRYW
jgi:hypothetical protein